ncbi:hypothetical protein HG530_004106 [Fusarium avenaceum]|nr:hypothetical protein HG530_004106 [Fusarium avenaceum]
MAVPKTHGIVAASSKVRDSKAARGTKSNPIANNKVLDTGSDPSDNASALETKVAGSETIIGGLDNTHGNQDVLF